MMEDAPYAIETAPLRETLKTYCRALTGRGVELEDLQQLVDKNIGWSRLDVATSDGNAIFLPALTDHFQGQRDNYEFLKVMLTQQAAHIEFGSFDFEFDRPSTRFEDFRPRLRFSEADAAGEHDHHHEDVLDPTDFTRFFRLFPDKQLAFDIFALLESSRVETRVMDHYQGIAKIYRTLRVRTLAQRQEIIFLPAREAVIELMIRVSLGWKQPIRVPKTCIEVAATITSLMGLVCTSAATVEDSAEAGLRIYALLSGVENEFLEEAEFAWLDVAGASGRRADAVAASKRWDDKSTDISKLSRVPATRKKSYLSPAGVDYRGEFRPELAQLLSHPQPNAREERKALTQEQLAELLRHQITPRPRDPDQDEAEEQDPRINEMAHNLMREMHRRDPRMQSVDKRPWFQADDDAGALSANQSNQFVYDEWNVARGQYRSRWCRVYEKVMGLGDANFCRDALRNYAGLLQRIRREFEQVAPEIYQKEKRLPDGSDHDLDAAVEALTDLRIGVGPSEKIFWRHHKNERDVAVAFLLDMSGSTGESIAPTSALEGSGLERPQRRIIDVEKEAIVLMIDALEAIGDRYAVYGFSGHGRDNVEFYVMKDFDELYSPDVARRVGRAAPLHATRMGPAIRHATWKLRYQQTRSRFLFLISDGRPQDRGYSQESSEKAYAVHDTRMALIEARREGITPFCLTVDKEGNDYLRTMMDDFSYEVLSDVGLLPLRLPQLYKRLTF